MADLLFLAHRMPFPAEKGDTTRSWHILRHLAARHCVHLGCFYDDLADARHIPALEEHCASHAILRLPKLTQRVQGLTALRSGKAMSLAYFHDERLMRWIAETLARYRPQQAFVCGSVMAPYLDGYRFGRRVIDMGDLHSETWREQAERRPWPLRAVYRREATLLLRAEVEAVRCFDATLFASIPELSLFVKRAHRPKAPLLTLRNGVDLAFFNPARAYPNPYPAGRQIIVFTGAMDYGPNIEAARWFAAEMMTALRHRFAALEFWIVGAHPARAIRTLACHDIRVTGRVDDIRPYLAHAHVVVAPIQSGRGVQNQVLEGMAMARPVVATPAALEGLALKTGEEVLGAANPPQFATAIAQILGGGGPPSLGARARARIVADHGWPASLSVLDQLFAEAEEARQNAS